MKQSSATCEQLDFQTCDVYLTKRKPCVQMVQTDKVLCVFFSLVSFLFRPWKWTVIPLNVRRTDAFVFLFAVVVVVIAFKFECKRVLLDTWYIPKRVSFYHCYQFGRNLCRIFFPAHFFFLSPLLMVIFVIPLYKVITCTVSKFFWDRLYNIANRIASWNHSNAKKFDIFIFCGNLCYTIIIIITIIMCLPKTIKQFE